MSNHYHFEAKNISRGTGGSFARNVSYIYGRNIEDNYAHKKYYHKRSDVVFSKVYLPENAPAEYRDIQRLSDEINNAEKRYDARTARVFIASFPNKLSSEEQIKIVEDFVRTNFVDCGFAVVAAIHSGVNVKDPSKNNPHAHILVSTRTVDANGFSRIKPRELNKKQYIRIWREQWAHELNRELERNKLDIRVSHESFEVQGIEREPTIHLSQIDFQKEKRGERTIAGDRKREIQKRNEKKRQREKERDIEREKQRTIQRSR